MQAELGVSHKSVVIVFKIFFLSVQEVIGEGGSQEEQQEGGPPHGCSESTLNA